MVGWPGPNGTILRGMNYSLFKTLTERVPVFQATFARLSLNKATVLVGDTPAETPVELVSGNYFPALGINAAVGRLLGPSDDLAGAPVVVLGHRLQPATAAAGEAFAQPVARVVEALEAMSGVKGAAATSSLPALEVGGARGPSAATCR